MKNFLAGLASALMLTACVGHPSWRGASGAVWGTTYHMTYECDRDLADSLVAVTSRISESLSMFLPSSTVSRINSGETDSVDAHFMAVYDLAREVSAASNGMFDPTVAPLVDLWGFGRDGRDRPLPDSADVAEALEKIGISRSVITHDGRLEKGHPEMEFDFSAIAKGYGVDKVAEMLHRNGCRNFMVEIGGEIRLAGHNPNGRDWHIQIDAPVPDSSPGDSAMMVLKLTDCAIATSGNYRNFRVIEGDSIAGHTIDPISGYPAPRRVISATVIAPECALADALATALMASAPDSASNILARFPSARAIMLLPSGRLLSIPSIPATPQHN